MYIWPSNAGLPSITSSSLSLFSYPVPFFFNTYCCEINVILILSDLDTSTLSLAVQRWQRSLETLHVSIGGYQTIKALRQSSKVYEASQTNEMPGRWIRSRWISGKWNTSSTNLSLDDERESNAIFFLRKKDLKKKRGTHRFGNIGFIMELMKTVDKSRLLTVWAHENHIWRAHHPVFWRFKPPRRPLIVEAHWYWRDALIIYFHERVWKRMVGHRYEQLDAWFRVSMSSEIGGTQGVKENAPRDLKVFLGLRRLLSWPMRKQNKWARH